MPEKVMDRDRVERLRRSRKIGADRGIERDGSALMLQQIEEAEDGPAKGMGRGVALYFICDDADAMHAELTSRGLDLKAPKVAYYGMNQLYVPEPDGYVICFESPTEPCK